MNHLVLLSGGKDSTAMALRLREVEPRDYTYLCTPTGAELPDMEAHWSKLEGMLGHTFRSDQRDTHPAALADLRQEFEEGYVPRGADQLHLDIETGTRCAICSM